MEQLILDISTKWAFLLVPVFAGLFCSFVIEAVLHYTPEALTLKWVILIVTFPIAVLMVWGTPTINPLAFDKVLSGLLSIAFSIAGYYAFGKRIVQLILSFVEKKIGEKTQ